MNTETEIKSCHNCKNMEYSARYGLNQYGYIFLDKPVRMQGICRHDKKEIDYTVYNCENWEAKEE